MAEGETKRPEEAAKSSKGAAKHPKGITKHPDDGGLSCEGIRGAVCILGNSGLLHR